MARKSSLVIPTFSFKFIMKQRSIITTLLFISIAFFTFSCAYDDTELKEKVNEIDNRLSTLEQTAKEMNESISSLMTIVNALKNQDQIVSVTPLEDGTGYTVTFSKSGTITIKNGSDGTPGSDGHSPSVNIKLDLDGNYYWTLDDKFITDDAGNKIPATSTTLVPQIRINEGNFELSFDGLKWEIIGSAGSAGKIKDVQYQEGDEYVRFILSDNSVINIPVEQVFSLVIEDSSIPVTLGEQVMIPYSITAADSGTVIDLFTTKGLNATINYNIAGNISSGSIVVDIPNPLVDGKVFVFAVNSKGVTSTRILTFEEGVFEYEPVSSGEIKIPAAGKTVEFPVRTNYRYDISIPNDAQTWISTKIEPLTRTIREELILFTISENKGEIRSAKVNLMKNNVVYCSFTIKQESAQPEEKSGYSGSIEDWKNDEDINL